MLLNFIKNLVFFLLLVGNVLKQFELLVPNYIGFFNFWIETSVIKIIYLCLVLWWVLLSFCGGPSVLLWQRSVFPFVEEMFLSFFGGGLFILLWWRSLYPFVVKNVGGFGCMPGFSRNMVHFNFDVLGYPFWMLFCEDIIC